MLRKFSGRPAVCPDPSRRPSRPSDIPDEDWSLAVEREKIISELIGISMSPAVVDEACERLGLGRARLYELVRRYRDLPQTSSLVPERRGQMIGRSRLNGEIDEIVRNEIQQYYLRLEQPNVAQLVRRIKAVCAERGVPAPSKTTVKRRIEALPLEKIVRSRKGNKKANNSFRTVIQEYRAERPLEIVQMDHTKADIFLVEEGSREVIGRPWITLAVDVATRMIYSVYISPFPPSATSVAIALAQGALPKESWLSRHGIAAPWPVHGLPETLHTDNGKEFHSQALKRGCTEFGIRQHHRPVRTPHYGGHIERLIGTMMGEVHLLPGTTFSNVQERGEYRPDKHATMTLREFTQWFLIEVAKYHNSLHTALSKPPIAAWIEACEAGFVPRAVRDETRFLIAFLPGEPRMVGKDGITWNCVHYYSPALALWKGLRLMTCYNPHDMSRVFVRGPNGDYMAVPYRNITHPAATAWELKQARDHLRTSGRKQVNEALIFDAVKAQRQIEAEAALQTKTARRNRQRARHAAEVRVSSPAPVHPFPSPPVARSETEHLEAEVAPAGETPEPAANAPESDDIFNFEIWE